MILSCYDCRTRLETSSKEEGHVLNPQCEIDGTCPFHHIELTVNNKKDMIYIREVFHYPETLQLKSKLTLTQFEADMLSSKMKIYKEHLNLLEDNANDG